MNPRSRCICSVLCLALASAPDLAAQLVPADQAGAVIGAALTSARPFAPPGETAAEVPATLGILGAQVKKALAVARMNPGSLADARVCTGGTTPSNCHLVGPTVFLQVTRVAGTETAAEVDVRILDETSSTRQPIHGQEVTVTVVREGTGWRVTKVTPLWTS